MKRHNPFCLAGQHRHRNISDVNEIQRLAYLDALGIDSYISRSQLPAAAPSRRLRIVRPVQATPAVPELLPAVPAPEPEPAAVSPGPAAKATSAGVDPPATARPVAGVPAPEAPAAGVEAPPMFSVMACYLGGRYWLDEVPRSREPGDDYQVLLQGICIALGWDPGKPVLERFDWPMHHNRQLDQGQEAARHGFEGFIRARLEQRPVSGIVLLGEPEGGWFDAAVFGGLQIVTTVSAWRMLRQPELKKVAWRDLKVARQLPG
jgi:hypothetical protein